MTTKFPFEDSFKRKVNEFTFIMDVPKHNFSLNHEDGYVDVLLRYRTRKYFGHKEVLRYSTNLIVENEFENINYISIPKSEWYYENDFLFFLFFLYHGRITLTEDNCIVLIALSVDFEVKPLTEFILQTFLVSEYKCFSVRTLVSLLNLLSVHNDSKACMMIADRLAFQFCLLQNEAHWMNLSQESVMYMLKSDNIICENEFYVWKMLRIWMTSHEITQNDAFKLLEGLRINFISKDEFLIMKRDPCFGFHFQIMTSMDIDSGIFPRNYIWRFENIENEGMLSLYVTKIIERFVTIYEKWMSSEVYLYFMREMLKINNDEVIRRCLFIPLIVGTPNKNVRCYRLYKEVEEFRCVYECILARNWRLGRKKVDDDNISTTASYGSSDNISLNNSFSSSVSSILSVD